MNVEEIRRRLAEVCERVVGDRGDVVAVYLYGSVARGEAYEGSDIDVGVRFRSRRSLKELASLSVAFAEEGVEVDLAQLNQDDVVFLHDVITEGVLVYEGDREARVDFEVDVARRFHDMKPLIQEYWDERRKRVAHAGHED